jgi:hypothetical protein
MEFPEDSDTKPPKEDRCTPLGAFVLELRLNEEKTSVEETFCSMQTIRKT